MGEAVNLDEIFYRFGSDKGLFGHLYGNFYASHIGKPESILEIGILKGESILAWKEIFPNAKLIGMDLFEHNPIPDIANVQWIKANQLDHFHLYHIRNNIKPEIIIEDCSHNCIDHWVTFFSLISCCKKYFIEDLHTCYDEFYRQGLKFEQTILGAMKLGNFPFKFELSNDHKIAVIQC